MRSKVTLVLLAAIVCILAFSGTVSAKNFSADVVFKSDEQVMTGKIYIADQKMRMDLSEMITITRMDKKVVWTLMPDEKMYMEMALMPGQHIPGADEETAGKVERVRLGTENVNGLAADKYRVTLVDDKDKDEWFEWIAIDSGFPVKMASVDNSWSHEYKNIVFGEPPAAKFEVPAGYTRMAMPGR